MERLTYEDFNIFIDEVIENFETLDEKYPCITFIAKYTEANAIIKELVNIGNNIASIELHNEKFDGYSDEYIIGLDSEGIWCEKFKSENGYLQDESSIAYIMDNCCSKVIKHCKSDLVYEVYIGSEADNEESVYVSISKKDDGTPTGFIKSWSITKNGMTSYSTYSHFTDDVSQLREVAESFGIDLQ